MKSNSLKIDNPCPVALLSMKKDGDNYFCRSCSKTVIDFRNMADQEIAAVLTAETCGIFNNQQLPGQLKPALSMRMRFAVLAVFSILGVNLKAAAQTAAQQKIHTAEKQPVKGPQKNSLPVCPRPASQPVKQEAAPAPKKTKYITIGCPSF